MGKNIWNHTWYVLSKTWKFEKRVLFVLVLQTVIGAAVPVAGAVLPALVVNGISNGMDSGITMQIAAVILLLLLCNTVSAYLSNIYGTYVLNDKIGFLSALFRQKMKVDYAYVESPEGQNKYQNAMMSILNDNSGIPGMLSLIGPCMAGILGIIVNMVLIIEFNVWIVAVLVITSAIHLFIASRIRRKQDTLREPAADASRNRKGFGGRDLCGKCGCVYQQRPDVPAVHGHAGRIRRGDHGARRSYAVISGSSRLERSSRYGRTWAIQLGKWENR